MSKWKEMREAEAQATIEEEQVEEAPTLEDVEQGFLDTTDSLHEAFRNRAEREKKRFHDACDSNHYFTVYFTSFEQLEEFCDSVGLDPMLLYIDGREFAKRIGRALKTPDYDPPQIQPFNKDYMARSLDKDSKWYSHE